MTLAAAIRAGSKKTRKYSGCFISEDGKSACALGAAMVALNLKRYSALVKRYPELRERVKYPAPNAPPTCLETIIFTLNDDYGLSRPQIAAWVEQTLAKNVP